MINALFVCACQDSSSRMCSDMKKWRCPAECAKEQYNTIITRIGGIRISTIFTVYAAKRAAEMR